MALQHLLKYASSSQLSDPRSLWPIVREFPQFALLSAFIKQASFMFSQKSNFVEKSRDFTHKVSEWLMMIRRSFYLVFVLQIYHFVESLEEEEDFLGVLCTFK